MSLELAVTTAKVGQRRAQEDPFAIRWTLITAAMLVMGVLVVIPLVNVFYEAFRRGPGVYWNSLFADPDTTSAILLTLRVAPVAVVLNVVFGVAAAWLIARFRFRGRTLLTALIDLPFAVSPVVAGLIFVLIFGLQGYLGPWLREHDIKIIFATPGLILATAFVTFPFVARELIPLMEAIGTEEEIAAVSLGARALQMFRRVTLPNIKWGLLYGVILCNARAMGEFGAVYVVSGHITGQTDTMPLRVEKLFQEYNMPGAFALASLLSSLALVTLAVKTALEWQTRRELESRLRGSPLNQPSGPIPSTPRLHLKSPEDSIDDVPRSEEDRRVGISVKNITKHFGDFVALDDVSLEVPHGSLVALLGPSGSGKTTLLRIIAGLDMPDEGAIHYQDEDATSRSARDRNVGFVFQHYALFRHMTVFENVAFGLRVRRWPEKRIQERVHELLRLIQLDDLGRQAPSQLSGGQRQRVALARALAAEPKVLLLDEPFGALDAKVRQELRQWLRKLHDEIHVTSVFVTHDQEEAFEVSDRVVVMNRGRIEQQGSPQEVFDHPANAFVMDFLGNVNVFHGRVAEGFAKFGLDLTPSGSPHDPAKPVTAYVRPHELEIDRIPRGNSSLKAEVVRINAAGAAVKVEVAAQEFGININVEIGQEQHARLNLRPGDRVFVFPRRVRVFVQDYTI
ncbi:MAG: sulfate ABC transporter permease subunit CysW [Deltaproteobacteria bacterium]|nr:sulfate ABC transporter permease subunit CysW [Deltaproteobacteria bacterium]MBI3389237.1 sulfate ABC transporter permease subunit CysW [Deltaproteobacteria bacterium]